MVSVKLGIELGMLELKNMYNIKKNGVDKGIVYVFVRFSRNLALKLLESISS